MYSRNNSTGANKWRKFGKKAQDQKKVFFQNVGNNQIVMTYHKSFYSKPLINLLVDKFSAIRIDIPQSDKRSLGNRAISLGVI